MHLVMRQRNYCVCLAYAIKNLELCVISRPQYSAIMHNAFSKNP